MDESRAVVDLAWAINSPSLLNSPDSRITAPACLDLFSVDAGHLTQFLERNPSRRVGRYFEQLVRFYLHHVLEHEIVACQQPIIADGRTIGELDFLYRDHAGLLTHMEVAVKFYLHQPDSPHNGSHYVGPNGSDTFERKTQRLFEHQLPLSKTYVSEVDRHAVLMKGRIYYHAGAADPAVLPERMSDSHLRGTWIRSCELDQLRSRRRVNWAILDKPYWLTVGSDDNVLTTNQFQERVQRHFAKSQSPLHCASIANGREEERIFVVADQWPA